MVRIVLDHLGTVLNHLGGLWWYELVLDHLGGVCGGTNSLKSRFVVVRIVLDHLGGVCGGTNCLRSSWWGLWWYE